MKVAVVYNRESKNVINLFGQANQELIGLKTIKRIVNALKSGGHQATSIEGDKDLIDRLEEFMPRVVAGERPGMVFNVSYGIQGKARYSHVPSILEMVGIPYVASNPLAHSLALDKVVSKMIFKQEGIPTADFFVLREPDSELPEDIVYPVIVKPKNEAVSFGIKVCHDADELREAAGVIFDKFSQPVLVEQYIDGREVNVGIIGNDPPEALPAVELSFGDGPKIYTYEDKTRKSGREIVAICPAPLGDELTAKVQDVARRAFVALQCSDCCRVDMRLDSDDNIYVLEVNSLPSMGEHGSYVEGAAQAGLDYVGLVNRLVEVASARYFGTATAATIELETDDPSDQVFRHVTERRDQLERQVRQAVAITSRSSDRIGIREAAAYFSKRFADRGLKPVDDLTDVPAVWTLATPAGLEGGTLFIASLDVPHRGDDAPHAFRRDPEWLFGEGIGSSRASLAMLDFALGAVKRQCKLNKMPLGVLLYADEGEECEHSAVEIRRAAERAARVIVLRPGTPDGKLVTKRRGDRQYRFRVTGRPQRAGRSTKLDALAWAMDRMRDFARLNNKRDRITVSTLDIDVTRYPSLLPHRVSAIVSLTYGDAKTADATEAQMRTLISRSDLACELDMLSDRPPLKPGKRTDELIARVRAVADRWRLPLPLDSSLLPSVAGLVPADTPVLCGFAPLCRDVDRPGEAVQRLSLLQRTLLVSQLLVDLAT